MLLPISDATSYYVRRYLPTMYARFQREVKKQVQLQGSDCQLVLKWTTSTPSADLLKIRAYSVREYDELVEKNLCVLNEAELRNIAYSPGEWYAPIYQPFIDSLVRWQEPSARRKFAISEVLKDMQKEDPRTFGERMRDLKREKLRG